MSTANPAFTKPTSALTRSRPSQRSHLVSSVIGRFARLCAAGHPLAPRQQTGLVDSLEKLWPAARSAPSPARYLLLAAFHRICQPESKTEVADWYGKTVLNARWAIPAERFTSQAFWDPFEKILPEQSDPLAPAMTIRWTAHKCSCWACGRESR